MENTKNIDQINVSHELNNLSENKPTREPFWKLFRGKYLITFSLCSDCREILFKKSDKAVRNGERVEVRFDMCEGCFKKNCRTSDIITPYKPKTN
uniref:Uncharacterized protein n=1 Tax=Meloidogyne incognita TaxID=6306 RepID=A0A914M1L7_MELIC